MNPAEAAELIFTEGGLEEAMGKLINRYQGNIFRGDQEIIAKSPASLKKNLPSVAMYSLAAETTSSAVALSVKDDATGFNGPGCITLS